MNDLQRKQLDGGGPDCNLWILRSSEDGIRIGGPFPAAEVVARIERETRENEREPVILDRMPSQDKGCFSGVPEGAIVILRGEVVTLASLTRCPCESGKAFAECHGATSDVCEHDKVYAGFDIETKPRRTPWVCRTCKERGDDIGVSSRDDGAEYDRLTAE